MVKAVFKSFLKMSPEEGLNDSRKEICWLPLPLLKVASLLTIPFE